MWCVLTPTKRRGTARSAWFLRSSKSISATCRKRVVRKLLKLPAPLAQLVQLFVEVRQSRFQSLFVVGVGRRFQIVQNVFAREFDVRAFPVFLNLFRRFWCFSRCRHGLLARYLRFYVLTFPAARHR